MGEGMKNDLVKITNAGAVALRRPLTPAQFGDLADIPPELEWLANLTNPKTRRAYKIDVEEFIAFAGLGGIAGLRSVTRAHVIAWRKDLEKRELAHSSIRRKLSALSALQVSRISDDEKRSLANAIANLIIHTALRIPDE
jgi:Phage integrase, N-terminal SAM-like domain